MTVELVVELLKNGSQGVVTIGVLIIIFLIRRLDSRVELNTINQEATDFALEKSIGNGYSKHRAAKKEELMKDSKYIKG